INIKEVLDATGLVPREATSEARAIPDSIPVILSALLAQLRPIVSQIRTSLLDPYSLFSSDMSSPENVIANGRRLKIDVDSEVLKNLLNQATGLLTGALGNITNSLTTLPLGQALTTANGRQANAFDLS